MDTETPLIMTSKDKDDLVIPIPFIFYMNGTHGGVFLARLCQWSLEQENPGDWFTKSLADWKDGALVGKRRVARYTKELTEKGVLETKTEKHGRSHETFYKLDVDTLIQKVLEFEAKRKG